jgi:hypothetical protein
MSRAQSSTPVSNKAGIASNTPARGMREPSRNIGIASASKPRWA